MTSQIDHIPVVTACDAACDAACEAVRMSQETLLRFMAANEPSTISPKTHPASRADSQVPQTVAARKEANEPSRTDATDEEVPQSPVDCQARDFSYLSDSFPPVFLDMLDQEYALMQRYFSVQFYEQLLLGKDARDHLLVRLNSRLNIEPMVRICQEYRKNNGLGTVATHTIGYYCRGLILRHLYSLSFRSLEHSVRYDWLYRWFVGYPLFGPTFDHTTLADFSKWVETNHLDLFFVEILRQIYEDFPEEKDAPQMGDTFAMQANAAQESLIRRMRHTCHLFFCTLADIDMNLYSSVVYMIDREALFGKEKERSEYYLSASERAERACQVGNEAAKLIRLAHPVLAKLELSPERVEMTRRLNQLQKILNDEFDIKYDETGVALKITKKEKHVKGAYRIISATDPEATFRVHGEKIDFGFNIQVAATKNFVTGMVAETGCSPDNVTIPAVLTYQYTHFDFYPYKFIYDQAAGSGKTVYQVYDATAGQTQLVARMVDHTKNSKRYGPADFTLSEDGLSMTCPNGQTTDRKYRHGVGDGWTYRFTSRMCQGCPLLTECRGGKTDKTDLADKADKVDLADKADSADSADSAPQVVLSARNVYYSDYRVPYIRAVNVSPVRGI